MTHMVFSVGFTENVGSRTGTSISGMISLIRKMSQAGKHAQFSFGGK